MPSPFLLMSGLWVMSVECLVSVFAMPSCLADIEFGPPGGLEAAG